MSTNRTIDGVAVVVDDWRPAYRSRGLASSPVMDKALRSLTLALDQLASGAPTRLYLGLHVGPPTEVSAGSIKRARYHSQAQSLELDVGLDATLPDSEVGPSLGRLAIDAIAFGREELARKKVDFPTETIVERIERWIASEEWLAPLAEPSSPAISAGAAEGRTVAPLTERLEIHVRVEPPRTTSLVQPYMDSLEDDVEQLLAGTGVLEGNEVGPNEWVSYLECSDADAALGKLVPLLRGLPAAATIDVVKCKRITIR